jgi:hypothetical protein
LGEGAAFQARGVFEIIERDNGLINASLLPLG